MGGVPRRQGPRRSPAKFLPRCFDVWTFIVRLNVTTTKKRRQLFLEKKCSATDKKILASRTRKGSPFYVGMGPSEWLIRPWGLRDIFYTYVKTCLLTAQLFGPRNFLTRGPVSSGTFVESQLLMIDKSRVMTFDQTWPTNIKRQYKETV